MNSIATPPQKAVRSASERPWRASNDELGIVREVGLDDAGIPITRAVAFVTVGPRAAVDRELIIRAVNAHDELVEAATDALLVIINGSKTGAKATVQRLEAALRLAGGLPSMEGRFRRLSGLSSTPGLLAQLPAPAHGVCDVEYEQQLMDEMNGSAASDVIDRRIINDAMDDINDGGDSNPAQFSSDV